MQKIDQKVTEKTFFTDLAPCHNAKQGMGHIALGQFPPALNQPLH